MMKKNRSKKIDETVDKPGITLHPWTYYSAEQVTEATGASLKEIEAATESRALSARPHDGKMLYRGNWVTAWQGREST